MNNTIEICGEVFKKDIDHFSFSLYFSEISEMKELQKLRELPHITSATFSDTNLNDTGLKYLIHNCPNLTNLNLQNTKISNHGIKYLALCNHLKILRLKANDQLTNNCIDSFNVLNHLEDLQIHETSITVQGLKKLKNQKLKYLMIDSRDADSKEAFIEVSSGLKECSILVKGKIELLNGEILWER